MAALHVTYLRHLLPLLVDTWQATATIFTIWTGVRVWTSQAVLVSCHTRRTRLLLMRGGPGTNLASGR